MANSSICKSKLPLIIIFIIVSDLLYTIFINPGIDYLKNEPKTFEFINIRTRPNDGYILDTTRVMKRCNMKFNLVEKCLEYLDKKEDDYMIRPPIYENSEVPPKCNKDEPSMLFHVFWRGMITDKLALQMKSFIYTQPLACSKLYVWLQNSDTDIESNPYARDLYRRFSPKNIVFKRWDTEEQLNADDLYKGWKSIMSEQRSVAFSDLVRFVVLNRYGGMYMDGDVLFLRDMRPLYHTGMDFSYKWSYKTEYNTAVLRLHANGTTSRKIISQAMINNMNFHPYQIKTYLLDGLNTTGNLISSTKSIYNSQLYMYSVPLFDPLWLKNDRTQTNILSPNLNGMDDVWEPEFIPDEFPGVNTTKYSPLELRKVDNFFRGAFAYHWHNNWDRELLPSCWMGVLNTAYDSFINGKQTNIYGEIYSKNKDN